MMYAIEHDDLYPRDEEHRYRLYARRGDELEVLATAGEPGGIGEGIISLHEDEKSAGGRLSDRGAFGILDVVAGEWIVLPWLRPDPAATFGELPLPIAPGSEWIGKPVRSRNGSVVYRVGELRPLGYRLTPIPPARATPIFRRAKELDLRWEVVSPDPEGER